MPVPTTQPQRAASAVGRPDPGVAQRLLGGGEREAVRAVGELEELAVVDRAVEVEALHLGGDAHREAARVEQA